MKKCNNCPYFYECWEEYSDYCYRDGENLKTNKGINDIRLNSINARMGLIRHKIAEKNKP